MSGDLPILHPLTRWAADLKLGEHVLRGWVDKGWLKPSVVSGRIKLYRSDDIDNALLELQRERVEEVEDIRDRLRSVATPEISVVPDLPAGELDPAHPIIGIHDPWPAGEGEAP